MHTFYVQLFCGMNSISRVQIEVPEVETKLYMCLLLTILVQLSTYRRAHEM